MKVTMKRVVAALVMISTVAFSNSADANWSLKAVKGTTQGESQTTPAVSASEYQFQIAQTPVGSCVVSVRPGSSLNIRQRPSTNSRIVGSLRNGARVALGVTDGSEGKNWTRIIAPVEGYVARANLRNCRTRG
ncbi:MAG: SH3 domain-containing protein [Scytonematopsis contorta HA4267-MV1]|jgi:uncharacterized protein YgiM (DUF1202 family)|nr:SH3 domain-containing protein [Scytonematopsis contorta HA4267-MV1]